MDLMHDLLSRLEVLGVSEEKISDIKLPDAATGSSMSIRGFMSQLQSEEDEVSVSHSTGEIHLSGDGVILHSAPMEHVGSLLSSAQKSIDSIGCYLASHFTSLRGQLPKEFVSRTQMNMVASPLPGSICIEIAPATSWNDEMRPNGEPLFDIREKADVHPLADLSFEKFIKLLDLADKCSKEGSNDRLVDEVALMGPRVASSFKDFLDSLGAGKFDLETTWYEYRGGTFFSRVGAAQAKQSAVAISRSKLDEEECTLSGTLLTVTSTQKDKIRILLDDNSEVCIKLGNINPDDLTQVGARVNIQAKKIITTKGSGTKKERYVGISMSKDDTLH